MADLCIHVALAATALSVIFFFYVSRIEEKIIETQIDSIIDHYMSFLDYTPSYLKGHLQTLFRQLDVPDMSAGDQQVLQNNNQIKRMAAIALGAGCSVSIAFAMLIMFVFKLDVTKLLIHNFIIITAIVVVEMLFTTFVVQYYIYADVNLLANTVAETMSSVVSATKPVTVDSIDASIRTLGPSAYNFLLF